MGNVVTSLSTELSAANLWSTVGSVVPLIAISVLFSLGYYLVRKILRKTSRTKPGA